MSGIHKPVLHYFDMFTALWVLLLSYEGFEGDKLRFRVNQLTAGQEKGLCYEKIDHILGAR